MKKNLFRMLCLAAVALAAVSCSKPAHMAKYYDLVSTDCKPAVLEVVANNIQATYFMDFPDGYFHKRAILEVTPVLVYEGGEYACETLKLQGDKVQDNYQVIPRTGGVASAIVNIPYQPGMEASELKLRCTVIDTRNDKRFDYPAEYKLADGANITYMLAEREGTPCLAPHNYQKILKEKEEAQILYQINSSAVRFSELTKAEIKEFKNFLANLQNDERRTVTGTDIIAYASPDGPEGLNNKLSADRSKTASEAYDKVSKKIELGGDINVQTIGEDWEGFKELVEASSLEDKDLIIRVLSMYNDPAVREREIKNMSAVYQTLANKVLPQLRRARFITNIDFKNYTEPELLDLINSNIELLDENALLYAATLVNNEAKAMELYKKAAMKYNSQRAYTNIAALYLNQNNVSQAESALAKADAACPYTINNKAVCLMRQGKYDQAYQMLNGINLPEAKANQAVMDIYAGRYPMAAEKMNGQTGCNAAIAFILNNDLNKAENAITCNCAKGAYLRAIVAARKGNKKDVQEQLAIVNEKSQELAARAAKDIEFAKYR